MLTESNLITSGIKDSIKVFVGFNYYQTWKAFPKSFNKLMVCLLNNSSTYFDKRKIQCLHIQRGGAFSINFGGKI